MRLLTIISFFLTSLSFGFGQAYLSPELTAALPTGNPLEVVVTFHGDNAPTATNISLLEGLGITQGVTMRELPIAGVIATPAQINSLATDPSVRSLFLNYAITYDNNRGTALTGVQQLRTDPTITALNGGLPVSGDGIGVVVNDSGVDGTHPDHQFGENLVENVSAHLNLNSYSSILPYTPIEGVINTDAAGGHGTHVAGIVGATGAASSGLYEGVAPGADLIGYGAGAAVALLDVLSAFDYAIINQFRYGIRVVTNSWGTTSDAGNPFNPADPINVATKKCTDRNIVIVFSAGNSGDASGTISGNYKKAPWVICVAAGDKQGRLTDFSSRGSEGVGGTVTVDGQTFTWVDRPTVTAPGQAIISTRAISPIGVLSTPEDIELIEPAHLPFYTTLDGTSMAAPHVAGIVALMLEADPTLNPYEVKAILENTATNIPGRKDWEVGAGYVNAYAAVNQVFGNSNNYGSSLNLGRTFNANLETEATVENFTVEYITGGERQMTFEVAPGTTSLEAKTVIGGVLGETGNLLNLVLYSPSGQRYSAGVPVTFTLSVGRGVGVPNPEAGTWTLSIEGVNGLGLPETVEGTITHKVISGVTGISDVTGHPSEASVRLAVSNRLMDSNGSTFNPDAPLTRLELADYLLMGQGVRQFQPSSGALQFPALSGNASLLAESVMTTGAALRDRQLTNNALMTSAASGFDPNGTLNRAELAYTMAQSLGLQEYAESLADETITVDVDGQTIEVEDADDIPAELRGYVQAALNLNLINVYFSLTQAPFGLGFTIHAHFQPNDIVTRGEYAVISTRTFEQFVNPTQSLVAPQVDSADEGFEMFTYPNPATDRLLVKTGMIDYETTGTLSLVNAAGQVVYQNATTLFPQGELQLNVGVYPKGNYYLSVNTAEGAQFTKPVVIQ